VYEESGGDPFFHMAVEELDGEQGAWRLEITISYTVNDGLAPPGQNVMSILAKYYPYQLADGLIWDDVKEDVADDIIQYMARTMPDLPDLIVGRHLISPQDLETIYGLTESDIPRPPRPGPPFQPAPAPPGGPVSHSR
jgi:phytoene dehydrogenase-like protein